MMDLARPAVLSTASLVARWLHDSHKSRPACALLLGLGLVSLSWQAIVAATIPDPYLDEVFHIPQAQQYCQGKWLEWDDKITTPPALYTISVLVHRFLWLMTGPCSVHSLRMVNWFAILHLTLTAMQCRRLIEMRFAEKRHAQPLIFSIYAVHTGINIGLFPLLFFFSALYYTDVFSTLVVLVAFKNHLKRVGSQSKSWLNDLWTIFLGISALLMRQTNVFWIVVFIGGLEAVHAIKTLPPSATHTHKLDAPSTEGDGLATVIKHYTCNYASGKVHDPSMDSVWLQDGLICAVSLIISVLFNPFRVLRHVWPYIAVLGLFVAFVFWNGGVVLGDKSNHVATLHLAQMLYIWPLLTFFSAPLLIPLLLSSILAQWHTASKPGREEVCNEEYRRKSKKRVQTPSRNRAKSLGMAGYASLVALGLVIVKYNTVIHPFTLADNRHYMFYIFRHIILRRSWMRYAAVPIYILCLTACWEALGAPTSNPMTRFGLTPEVRPLSVPPLSTALLWLLTATLSLTTAPLVEPRYFIIPWVFWRLVISEWHIQFQGAPRFDIRLVLETGWFVLIHLATAYMFMAFPFYWKDENGALMDEGRVQRFMW